MIVPRWDFPGKLHKLDYVYILFRWREQANSKNRNTDKAVAAMVESLPKTPTLYHHQLLSFLLFSILILLLQTPTFALKKVFTLFFNSIIWTMKWKVAFIFTLFFFWFISVLCGLFGSSFTWPRFLSVWIETCHWVSLWVSWIFSRKVNKHTFIIYVYNSISIL